MSRHTYHAVCTFCGAEHEMDLSEIPDAVIKSEWSRRTRAKQKVHTGGRGGRPKGAKDKPGTVRKSKVTVTPDNTIDTI